MGPTEIRPRGASCHVGPGLGMWQECRATVGSQPHPRPQFLSSNWVVPPPRLASVLVALTLTMTTCLSLLPSQDSPTARRKSPYWAKVMRGSGSSRSHCLSTPVMAWMGKFSSLTAAGSVGKVCGAGERRQEGCAWSPSWCPPALDPYLFAGPTCPSTYLSAVPAGAPSCG